MTQPSKLLFEKRPSWSDLSSSDKALAVGLMMRSIFMIVKGLAFIAKSIQVGLLYMKTYKRKVQFETIFMFLNALKIVILMPDVFVYEMNWLYWSLAINSCLAYSLSYVLRMRTAQILDLSNTRRNLAKIWIAFRISVLFFVTITPAIDFNKRKADLNPHYLTCDPVLYRKLKTLF